MEAAPVDPSGVGIRTACGVVYALAVVPFYGSYFGSASQTVVAMLVAFLVAVVVGWLCRGIALWLYCLVLALVGYPLGYLTGLGPALAALLLTALAALAARRSGADDQT